MKLTNEQINALSDEQVNVIMTKCIYNAHDHDYAGKNESITLPNGVHVSGGALYKIGNGLSFMSILDYCNDPAVMMKIAAENKIGLLFSDIDVTAFTCQFSYDGPMGRHEFDSNFEHSESPEKYCRAAAIVYLKMRGVL